MEIKRFKSNHGFTIIEAIVTLAVIGILGAAAIPGFAKYKKTYEFQDDAAKMEYLVKFAKIYAMEKTKNIGVCVNGGSLTLYDIGTSRSAAACSGTALSQKVLTPHSHVTLSTTTSGATFDPRGLAIVTGNVCVSYGNSYSKVCVSRAGIRTESGSGGCSACS